MSALNRHEAEAKQNRKEKKSGIGGAWWTKCPMGYGAEQKKNHVKRNKCLGGRVDTLPVGGGEKRSRRRWGRIERRVQQVVNGSCLPMLYSSKHPPAVKERAWSFIVSQERLVQMKSSTPKLRIGIAKWRGGIKFCVLRLLENIKTCRLGKRGGGR